MSLSNTPAGADCDPFCPWNAKEDEDAERCDLCDEFLDEDGMCTDCAECDDEEDDES